MLNERRTRMSRAPRTLSAAFSGDRLRAPAVPRGVGLPLVKARAFQAREKQPHQNDGFSRGRLYSTKEPGGSAPPALAEARVQSIWCGSLPSRITNYESQVTTLALQVTFLLDTGNRVEWFVTCRKQTIPTFSTRHKFEGAAR